MKLCIGSTARKRPAIVAATCSKRWSWCRGGLRVEACHGLSRAAATLAGRGRPLSGLAIARCARAGSQHTIVVVAVPFCTYNACCTYEYFDTDTSKAMYYAYSSTSLWHHTRVRVLRQPATVRHLSRQLTSSTAMTSGWTMPCTRAADWCARGSTAACAAH